MKHGATKVYWLTCFAGMNAEQKQVIGDAQRAALDVFTKAGIELRSESAAANLLATLTRYYEQNRKD